MSDSKFNSKLRIKINNQQNISINLKQIILEFCLETYKDTLFLENKVSYENILSYIFSLLFNVSFSNLNGWETFGRSEASLKLGIQYHKQIYFVTLLLSRSSKRNYLMSLCRAFCSPVNLNVVCTRQGKVEGTQEVASM